MQRGHLDDKGEQVIDDGVEELVGELAPGEVRHTLHAVVQVQLRALRMHTGVHIQVRIDLKSSDKG